ncbi:MAG: YIP1 family protein [Gammaproteobacteria bacterium]|nr:YIP1 family protein [Gammaproteobacteria bacterium]
MNHILGILLNPTREWGLIRDRNDSVLGHYLRFLLVMAILPPLAWYYGASEIGWTLGDRVIRLTPDSAMQIMILFYLSILVSVACLGFMIHWMAETYGAAESSMSKGVGIAAYTLTPMFVCGITGFYPVLWLDILLATASGCYTVYLLYLGVPIVMEIPRERGFLFASAMVAVGLVMMAGLLSVTVILWEMGAMPVFME